MQSIAAVRSRFEGSLGPEVAAWLMLAEGILWFSTRDFVKFGDRVTRALGIAIAANYQAPVPTCSAWLALSALNDRRYDEMISCLRRTLTLATKDDHQARARASLVLADAFHLAGRFDLARPWYEKTRQHATTEGDESTLSAMLHNVAAFRASNVKFADALGTQLAEEARRAALEASSAATYDRAIGTKSFDQLIPHVVEQLFIVEGKYREAYEQLVQMDVDKLPSWGHATHYADFAFCAWHLGEQTLVGNLVPKALAALNGPIDADDSAYTCCRLASIFVGSGDLKRAEDLRAKAAKEAARYREFQSGLEAKLILLSAELEIHH